MSGGRAEDWVKGIQALVGEGWIGLRGHLCSVLGGGIDRGGVLGGQYGDGDRLHQWEDNVADVILGTEPNTPLVDAQ